MCHVSGMTLSYLYKNNLTHALFCMCHGVQEFGFFTKTIFAVQQGSCTNYDNEIDFFSTLFDKMSNCHKLSENEQLSRFCVYAVGTGSTDQAHGFR
jgi:hypothetical protein